MLGVCWNVPAIGRLKNTNRTEVLVYLTGFDWTEKHRRKRHLTRNGKIKTRILIAGGGLAGLAAAVALTDRGYSCEIVESKSRLGGRASSFFDPTSGTSIDNCQHVSLGCCTNFRHFCVTTKLDEFFRREKRLNFIGPGGTIDHFQATSLPAPFHLAGSFARLSYLTWREKLSLARGLKSLAGEIPKEDRKQPFSQWLIRHGQSAVVRNRFWHVVLVSALSETLDRIDVEHARKVFVDTFLAHRDGWTVEIPTVTLEELYGGRLTDWLTSRGSTIRLQSPVERIELKQDRVCGVRLTSGETLIGDEFIVALPFFRIPSLFPESLANHPDLAGIQQLQNSPISSIHLWFDRPITELPHAVFVDGLCQWMFQRTVLNSPPGSAPNTPQQSPRDRQYYYQIVISASRALAGQSRDQILSQVLAELKVVWPETARANLLHSRQVTEHRAVFSPLPGVDALRPKQQSPVPNLQLAGDWTQTGWPATMEGAVRSGYLAAENVLQRLGKTELVIQPDLKIGLLTRLLMGVSERPHSARR